MSSMIRHGISAGKKSPYVGETENGIGQTSAWKVNAIVRAPPPVSTSKSLHQQDSRCSPDPAACGSIQFVTH